MFDWDSSCHKRNRNSTGACVYRGSQNRIQPIAPPAPNKRREQHPARRPHSSTHRCAANMASQQQMGLSSQQRPRHDSHSRDHLDATRENLTEPRKRRSGLPCTLWPLLSNELFRDAGFFHTEGTTDERIVFRFADKQNRRGPFGAAPVWKCRIACDYAFE